MLLSPFAAVLPLFFLHRPTNRSHPSDPRCPFFFFLFPPSFLHRFPFCLTFFFFSVFPFFLPEFHLFFLFFCGIPPFICTLLCRSQSCSSFPPLFSFFRSFPPSPLTPARVYPRPIPPHLVGLSLSFLLSDSFSHMARFFSFFFFHPRGEKRWVLAFFFFSLLCESSSHQETVTSFFSYSSHLSAFLFSGFCPSYS